MSELKPCKACKGSGFKNRSRTVICPECSGGGAGKERQRGYHLGHDTVRRINPNKVLCPEGHIKTGVSVDDDGNLRPYCIICHRKVVKKTALKRESTKI